MLLPREFHGLIFDCSAHLYMVMEVCAGGELFDRITEKDHYSEAEAR